MFKTIWIVENIYFSNDNKYFFLMISCDLIQSQHQKQVDCLHIMKWFPRDQELVGAAIYERIIKLNIYDIWFDFLI